MPAHSCTGARRAGRSRPARLGAVGGDRVPRIVRPRVLRVAALHFAAHLRVGVLPEAAQVAGDLQRAARRRRSEEHTSELQSLMRLSYAVFSLKTKKKK